ncbi:DUF3810 family protein [Candidatus Palauibacter sp.]|uniref:DUF3810 family protein n=1 Tax=Candidatus Palauibacter sp. TaxID=3101350 RepID=UPI003AF31612
MDRLRIPNIATYLPIAPSDLLLAAPLAARILFGASPAGRALQVAALGVYAGSAAIDWAIRADARRVDFEEAFGFDPLRPPPASEKDRLGDVERLVARLNDNYLPMRTPRKELAEQVDLRLTDFLAELTGQRLETSAQVRDFMLAQIVFPFALGAADPLTGDVAIFRSTGVFEPHVIAHEFCHRKGYLKEVEAQILGYLALADSGEPVLEQSAFCERLDRQLWVLADRDAAAYNEMLVDAGLREELRAAFELRHPNEGGLAGVVGPIMKNAYDARMKFTGQNGLSDYDEGFTNFLLAIEREPVEGT